MKKRIFAALAASLLAGSIFTSCSNNAENSSQSESSPVLLLRTSLRLAPLILLTMQKVSLIMQLRQLPTEQKPFIWSSTGSPGRVHPEDLTGLSMP